MTNLPWTNFREPVVNIDEDERNEGDSNGGCCIGMELFEFVCTPSSMPINGLTRRWMAYVALLDGDVLGRMKLSERLKLDSSRVFSFSWPTRRRRGRSDGVGVSFDVDTGADCCRDLELNLRLRLRDAEMTNSIFVFL